MITKKLLAAVGLVSLLAVPAMAQTTDEEKNGHHSNGGRKTEVPRPHGQQERYRGLFEGLEVTTTPADRRHRVRITWATRRSKLDRVGL
jgi:hypothetical protein